MRGLPLKEVLEQVVPELSISCLRLALSTPKVTEQLLKLDEQGVSSAPRGLACETDGPYKHARICVMCDSAHSGEAQLGWAWCSRTLKLFMFGFVVGLMPHPGRRGCLQHGAAVSSALQNILWVLMWLINCVILLSLLLYS